MDDTDVFLKDKTFIEPCLKVFSDFEKVSGSKLNRSKTKGLIRNVMEPMVFKGVTLTTGPEIVLGVPLGKTRNNAEFWSTLIKKLQSKLNIWKSRDLSFDGKIHIIKSIGISSISYAIDMIDIKTDHIKQINQLLYEFLWSGKKYNVKREICVLPRYMGGLGMVDIATVV